MYVFNVIATEDTFVSDAKPHQAVCDLPFLPVGIFQGQKTISYIFFNSLSKINKLDIKSAKLNLPLVDFPYKKDLPVYINLVPLRESFKDCCTSYYNKPALSHMQKKIYIPTDLSSAKVDVTKFIKMCCSGQLKNKGFALIPSDCNDGGVIFHSTKSLNDNISPTITVYAVNKKQKDQCDNQSFVESCTVTLDDNFSKSKEVWCYKVFSYIVQNTGTKRVKIKLQDSPDNVDFIDEEPEYEVLPGQSSIFVNRYFTRFARLKVYLHPDEKGVGEVKIWLQGKKQ